MEETQNQIAVIEQQPLPITLSDFASLETATSTNIDIMTEYLTPTPGEVFRCYFDKLETTMAPDITTGEPTELLHAFFFIEENGQVKRIRNASKRLVGALGNVPRGMPLEITYLGKVRNKNNSFMSDNWRIIPLRHVANSK